LYWLLTALIGSHILSWEPYFSVGWIRSKPVWRNDDSLSSTSGSTKTIIVSYFDFPSTSLSVEVLLLLPHHPHSRKHCCRNLGLTTQALSCHLLDDPSPLLPIGALCLELWSRLPLEWMLPLSSGLTVCLELFNASLRSLLAN
jgi:hypothetical protein